MNRAGHKSAVTKRTVYALAALLALSTIGCGESLLGWDGTRPVLGDWNGMHASLSLDVTGGEIEYDCAHGGLNAPLRPDAAGRFTVPGVHVPERGGPIREGEVPDSLSAIYFGTLRGQELTLRAAVGTDTIGPFTLRRNAPVRLLKCL